MRAVPLQMALMIGIEANLRTRPVAVLLGPDIAPTQSPAPDPAAIHP